MTNVLEILERRGIITRDPEAVLCCGTERDEDGFCVHRPGHPIYVGGVEAGVAQTVEEGPDPRPGNPDVGRASGEEQRSSKPKVPGLIPGPSLDSTSVSRPAACNCDGFEPYTHNSWCSYITEGKHGSKDDRGSETPPKGDWQGSQGKGPGVGHAAHAAQVASGAVERPLLSTIHCRLCGTDWKGKLGSPCPNCPVLAEVVDEKADEIRDGSDAARLVPSAVVDAARATDFILRHLRFFVTTKGEVEALVEFMNEIRAESQQGRPDLVRFVSWVANHPDVGDSLTAVEREKDFQLRAKEALRHLLNSGRTHER